MTKNNSKILLFVGLITAMILPFSTMDFAEAKTVVNVSDKIDEMIVKYNNLEVKRQELIQELRSTDDKKTKTVLSLEKRISETKSRMDTILSKVEVLAIQETTYEPTKMKISAITEGSVIYAGGTYTSCDNWSNSSSNIATGDINTGLDTINWGYGVTVHKNVGWFSPFCTDVYFEEITFNTRNNSKGQSCTFMESNLTGGNTSQHCNCGINNGDLLSWNVETTYEPISGTDTSGNDDWYGLHRVS